MKVKCPICGKTVKSASKQGKKQTLGKYFPFCSERCRLVDLGAWLDAEYKIPSEQQPPNDDSADE